MKRKLYVEIFEEHPAVTIYTIKYEGEKSETDKFFERFDNKPEYEKDVDIIIRWIDKICNNGALVRYFRPEGKYKDKLVALPVETSALRLYGLRISDSILILGNGGVKKTQAYNEDIELSSYAEDLTEVGAHIINRIKKEKLHTHNNKFYGSLVFIVERNNQ